MAKAGHSPKAILKYMIWAALAGIKYVFSLNLVDVFESRKSIVESYVVHVRWHANICL